MVVDAPRFSSSWIMCNPNELAMTSAVSPGSRVNTTSAKSEGSATAFRQPKSPPSNAVPAAEFSMANLAKSAPAFSSWIISRALSSAAPIAERELESSTASKI